jgi:hypothetical protein
MRAGAIRFGAAALAACSLTAAAAAHPCEANAREHAARLLKLHFDGDGNFLAEAPGGAPSDDGMTQWSLGPEIKILEPVPALEGTGKLDMLELTAFIYKAAYRLRFSYAQLPGACIMIGQEIVERVDPYGG